MRNFAISVFLMVIAVVVSIVVPLPAFAKNTPDDLASMLAECNRLIIAPEICNEQTIILSTRHHVPPRSPHDMVVETTIMPLLVGLGAAFAFGVAAVNKISRKVKLI